MNPSTGKITDAAADFVFDLLKTKLPPMHVYHNYTHTSEVVDAIKKIGGKSGLSDEELEPVILAGWFHDTGFTASVDSHEDKSIEIAREFLTAHSYPEGKLNVVVSCINATRYPQSPQNLFDEIICDADLYHLGTKDFDDKSNLLRVEWEKANGKQYSEQDWIKINIDFLTTHRFFTKYAKKAYDERKAEALVKLQKRYRKKLEKADKTAKEAEKLEVEKLKIESKKEESLKSGRGIETMFRNTVRTHVEFSAMADGKANIMISINTLIIGGIVTFLLRKLDANPQLIIPTFMLLAVSLVCIIFAVMVTRPKYSSGTFTKEDIKKKRTNLLFFGNFHSMSLEDFSWGMNEMMNDREFLYSSMIRDFYFLGIVLGRKYKYLRICYTIFMFGLIASVVAYAIAFSTIPIQPMNLFE